MNQHIKQVWLDALRSGQYKQVFGKAYGGKANQFCAQGLLAHLCSPLDGKELKLIIKWNDTDKLNFGEIAEKIEEIF